MNKFGCLLFIVLVEYCNELIFVCFLHHLGFTFSCESKCLQTYYIRYYMLF